MAAEGWLPQVGQLHVFEGIPPAIRIKIATLFCASSDEFSLANGDVLLREGQIGDEAGFVLVEGRAEVIKQTGEKLTLEAPELLGEMYQFNPRALRTATVKAAGPARLLKFRWRDLYAKARGDLNVEEQRALMDCVERVVWSRFDQQSLLALPFLARLPDRLRLRVCLPLPWIVRPVPAPAGRPLFEQHGICGGAGYILIHGMIELSKAGRPAGILQAPNLLGIFPSFDPAQTWSATATPKGPVEIERFSWQVYGQLLQQRLSPDELVQLKAAFDASSAEMFPG